MRLAYIAFLALSLPLFAQMPESWPENKPLGTGFGAEGPWYGAGTWAADSHGKLGTFVNSLGLGNALKGEGFYLEGGVHAKNWDMAAQVMAVRDPQGQSYLTLFRGHLTHTSRGGWVAGLEQEPLVWGYGLNGGYLLGEAARPFPRFRVESPMTHLQIGNAHFGTWGFQAFMGRLESDRLLSDSIQDLAYRKTILQNDPSSPLFNGYRIQARFADVMEFYVNYTNLWGGTRQGKKMTAGYNLGDYLTAMFGLKDQLAEQGVDFSDPNHPEATYKNNARSASNFDLGGRLRLRFLEQPLGAQTVHAYISRGTKNTLPLAPMPWSRSSPPRSTSCWASARWPRGSSTMTSRQNAFQSPPLECKHSYIEPTGPKPVGQLGNDGSIKARTDGGSTEFARNE